MADPPPPSLHCQASQTPATTWTTCTISSNINSGNSQAGTKSRSGMAHETGGSTASNGTEVAAMPPPTSNGTAEDLTTTKATALSADEFALYDRQVRVWGPQVQERIRSAHILLISLRALGTEIAKNLTLAGVNSLTIIDDEPVTEEDLGSQYFVREEDIGKPRAQSAIPRIQDLNPRVTVESGGHLNDLLGQNETYYKQFNCVIACDLDFMTLSSINTAARCAFRPFYTAGIHGFYGYIFADLFSHEFIVEREMSNIPTKPGPETLTRSVKSVTNRKESNGKNIEIVKKSELYCPLILANTSSLPYDVLSNRRKLKAVPALLPCLRALWDFQRMSGRMPSHSGQDLVTFTQLATAKSRELQLPPETLRAEFLRSFIQNIGAEIVPTAAFVGGRLSEDVLNVVGECEQPIQNFALFDGDGLEGKIYSLYTAPPELQMSMYGMGMQDEMGMGMGMVMGMDMSSGTELGDGTGFLPIGTMGDGSGGMVMADESEPAPTALAEDDGKIASTSAPANGADVGEGAEEE